VVELQLLLLWLLLLILLLPPHGVLVMRLHDPLPLLLQLILQLHVALWPPAMLLLRDVPLLHALHRPPPLSVPRV
jgi:hypothetical protein